MESVYSTHTNFLSEQITLLLGIAATSDTKPTVLEEGNLKDERVDSAH